MVYAILTIDEYNQDFVSKNLTLKDIQDLVTHKFVLPNS